MILRGWVETQMNLWIFAKFCENVQNLFLWKFWYSKHFCEIVNENFHFRKHFRENSRENLYFGENRCFLNIVMSWLSCSLCPVQDTYPADLSRPQSDLSQLSCSSVCVFQIAMSTISKRKWNEASIIRSFRYWNESKQLILTIFFIETKRCSLVQKVSISKRSEQIYHKTLQYRNETIEIISKLHSIVAKRTGLFSNLAIFEAKRTYLFQNCIVLKWNELVYYKTLQYRNETNKIISKLHNIKAKRTKLV